MAGVMPWRGAGLRLLRNIGWGRSSRAQILTEETLGPADEVLRHNGFRDVSLEAGGQHLGPVVVHGTGCHRHDRYLRELGVITQAPSDLEAVHPGQLQVAEDEIGFLAPGKLQTFLAVHRFESGVSKRGKQICHEVDVYGVIVDYKYACRHGFGRLALGHKKHADLASAASRMCLAKPLFARAHSTGKEQKICSRTSPPLRSFIRGDVFRRGTNLHPETLRADPARPRIDKQVRQPARGLALRPEAVRH